VALPSLLLSWHLRWVLSEFHLVSRGVLHEPDGCSAARGWFSVDPKLSYKIIQVVRYRIYITKFM
jgi:hypothetical protein